MGLCAKLAKRYKKLSRIQKSNQRNPLVGFVESDHQRNPLVGFVKIILAIKKEVDD